MKIYFVTHATTLDNEREIASGHLDAQLSPAGRTQAVALAHALRHLRFDIVCCSPLSRARETAALAFNGRHPVVVDERLSEVNYGVYNGAPIAQVDRVRAAHLATAFPGGESYEQRVALVRSFLEDFTRLHPGRTPLFVGHRATLYALQTMSAGSRLAEVVEKPFEWRSYWEFELDVRQP